MSVTNVDVFRMAKVVSNINGIVDDLTRLRENFRGHAMTAGAGLRGDPGKGFQSNNESVEAQLSQAIRTLETLGTKLDDARIGYTAAQQELVESFRSSPIHSINV